MSLFEDKVFQYQSTLDFSSKEVFDWLISFGAVQRLYPPWKQGGMQLKKGNFIQEGALIRLKKKKNGFSQNALFEIGQFQDGRSFTCTQIEGPFKKWSQTTVLKPLDEKRTELIDRLEYSPSLCFWSDQTRLAREFKWRHQTIAADLKTIKAYPSQPLRLLVTGSSGLVGRSLVPFLRGAGHQVVRLVRSRKDLREDTIFWDPLKEEIDKEDFEGFDGVIHLAGRNIASHLWTKEEKDLIFQSRVRDTWLLSTLLSRLKMSPRVFITASAVGYYGNRQDEELTESSEKGRGFLSDVVQKWEQAIGPLQSKPTKIVNMRFGSILSPQGGLLGRMLPVFKAGLGGKMGNGKQYMSWVALDDAIYAIYHALMRPELSGPVNVTAPAPLTQGEFAKKVARRLRRPAIFTMPAFLLKKIFGEMADELFLSSINSHPKKLQEGGFSFTYPTIDETLEHFC